MLPAEIPPSVQAEIDRLDVALQSIVITDLQGFTEGETTTFLREDGTFAEAGLTQAQVLIRASFRG